MAEITPIVVSVTKTHTPGYKTSEFWVTILTMLATFLGALDGVLPPKYAFLAVAFSQAAYTIARGMTKSGQPDKAEIE